MTPQAILLSMAPRFVTTGMASVVTDGTPVEHFAAFIRERGVMTVWSGASEHTIWRDSHVNHAFRAWHDTCHLAVGADFTLDGERRACAEQVRQLRERFPRIDPRFVRAIELEVIGQAEHFAAFGLFPEDQAAYHARNQ